MTKKWKENIVMTTKKWIRKQLEFALTPDSLEETRLHIQMILTRLDLSPLEQEMGMTIRNYADGVNGHYAIGRPIEPNSIYWEFYNNGKWCSAAEVFIGRDKAEIMLHALLVSGKK